MEEVEEPAPSLVDLLQATARSRGVAVPDFSTSAATNYLDHLLALPLQSLLQEAVVIGSEAGSVENELTNLCYREYPTFISVHKCSSAVTSAFDDFSSSLGRLLDAVPDLEEECRTFTRSTAGVQSARGKAALVQEHQDKLFDLLEIPQLIDTCVRNGYYQEALELANHTDSLVRRYPGIELVQDVAKEVDGVLQLMLAQLLALLREPIKLPALVKTVGYLRRLRTIDEPELSLVFLISRLSNFKAHLVGLERDRADAPRYVRKYVDLFREHIFDIISQFTAIFLEHSPSPVAAGQLASFVEQCVADLVNLLSTFIPHMSGDTASLSSILVQIGYCSLAFARVGLDFAPLLTGPFSSTVLSAFTDTIDAGTKSFSTTLAQAKSATSPAHIVIAHEYLSALLANPSDFVKWDGSYDHLPSDLARFPPLAILVNAHLTALNALRLLAPLHLYPRLAAIQAQALTDGTHALAQYVRAAVALSDPAMDTTRTHRRNSEHLTDRAARRKETLAVCTAVAHTWSTIVCPLLTAALQRGIFDADADADALPAPELQEALGALQAWAADVEDRPKVEANGAGTGATNGVDREGSPKANGSGNTVTTKDAPGERLTEPTEPEPAAEPVVEPTPEPSAELANGQSMADDPVAEPAPAPAPDPPTPSPPHDSPPATPEALSEPPASEPASVLEDTVAEVAEVPGVPSPEPETTVAPIAEAEAPGPEPEVPVPTRVEAETAEAEPAALAVDAAAAAEAAAESADEAEVSAVLDVETEQPAVPVVEPSSVLEAEETEPEPAAEPEPAVPESETAAETQVEAQAVPVPLSVPASTTEAHAEVEATVSIPPAPPIADDVPAESEPQADAAAAEPAATETPSESRASSPMPTPDAPATASTGAAKKKKKNKKGKKK